MHDADPVGSAPQRDAVLGTSRQDSVLEELEVPFRMVPPMVVEPALLFEPLRPLPEALNLLTAQIGRAEIIMISRSGAVS